MAHSLPVDDFTELIDIATPAILNHVDLTFDEMISSWMGEFIHAQYMRFKASWHGSQKSPELQIRYLLFLWRDGVGKEAANITGLVNLLSGKPLTANVVETLLNRQGEAEKRNTQLGTPTASCYEDDEELSKMLTELGISSLYKPLHTAAITTNVLWDMSDKDLYDIGLNKGSQLLYKKAKVEWENEERNKKDTKPLSYTESHEIKFTAEDNNKQTEGNRTERGQADLALSADHHLSVLDSKPPSTISHSQVTGIISRNITQDMAKEKNDVVSESQYKRESSSEGEKASTTVTMPADTEECLRTNGGYLVSQGASWPWNDKRHFDVVDAHAYKTASKVQSTLDTLANYLTSPFQSEMQKARVIYTWILQTTVYDKKLGKTQNGLFPGTDLSKLFKDLVDNIGMKSRVIHGNSRSFGSKRSTQKTPRTWNVVEIDKKWCFINITRVITLRKDSKGTFDQDTSNFYFLCHPIVHFYEHYPDNKDWLPNTWKYNSLKSGLEEWSTLICPSNAFFSLGLSLPGLFQYTCFESIVTSNSEIEVELQRTKEDIRPLKFKCYVHNSNKKEVSCAARMLNKLNQEKLLLAYFPSKGDYVLDVYGKLEEEESGNYQHVLKFKITNLGSGTNKIFPKLK